ncbi:MAG TPA: ABC transporter substrate-binding protein [Terriglobales bacterium]|nr:ABC transporter substrate-binding protein [Terriglobales bacterium]
MRKQLLWLLLCATCWAAAPAPQPLQAGEETAIAAGPTGTYGGRLVVGQRSEPKSLNPITAADLVSREVYARMNADLIHINRSTQQTEPALAKSWKVSPDGRVYTLKLRRGVRFSDGHPFDADDVVFSFQLYLDEKLNSPQRDLLVINGKPLAVAKLDQYTVRFTLASPYAAAERIFDGLAILPRHLLESAYKEGKLAQSWTLNTPPAQIAGLGPFRLKEYVPGQRIVLERNPYYWKTDTAHHRLPYLDELVFTSVGTEDAQILRFQAGDIDMLNRVSAENFLLLEKQRRDAQLVDLGPALEYNFLVFNLNDLSGRKLDAIARKQAWFSDVRFRQAISAAVDRDGLVRLVFGNHGAPLWGNVSPGNKLWVDQSLAHPRQSRDRAMQLLKEAGFTWTVEGELRDRNRNPVEFSILTSSSSAPRTRMATLLQEDLGRIGIKVNVVSLDFRAMLDRVFNSFDYEAAIMGLGGGDADPNPEMNVWLSSGSTHLWHLGEKQPATGWEAQLDRLMQQQMVTLNYGRRKKLYDQAQQIIAEDVPFVFLGTPNVLTAAKAQVGNFHPALLDPYTLWNADQLYLRGGGAAGK